jgi:CDP-4-dehydro-6-deoxyglucose reductase
VRFLPADVRLVVRAGESVVDAVRRQGYRTRYSCRRGGCGACKADLVEGEVDYPDTVAESVLSATERAAGKCLPCRAHPVGDVVIRLAGRDRLRRLFGPPPST